MATTISFTLNGTPQTVTVDDTGMPLLWVLRDLLGMTGTKYGCGIEICGACTVIVGNSAERSCDMDVGSVAGQSVLTVEGLASDPVGQKVQAAWVAAQVPQCGYCQSGFLMAATASVKNGNHGSSIAGDLSNICMCGTYPRIAKALASL